MAKEKLIISPHKYGRETTVISLRITKDMLKAIDDVAAQTGRTRNEIMIMSLEYALDNKSPSRACTSGLSSDLQNIRHCVAEHESSAHPRSDSQCASSR